MDIKEKIKERVNSINDPFLLKELLRAVETEYEIQQLEDLSELEKKAIDKGLEDANVGNLYSNSEAREQIETWVKK